MISTPSPSAFDQRDGQAQSERPLHRVVFQPAGRQGDVPEGTSLLDAARALGVEIESICGSKQTCGKCQVRIEAGYFSRLGIESSPDHVTPEGAREARYRLEKGLLPDCRQSCAALVLGDVLVTVPEESRTHKQVVRKAASQRAFEVNPAMRLCYVELPSATMDDERSDWARLADELAARHHLDRATLAIDPAILPALQPALAAGRTRTPEGDTVHAVTATIWRDRQMVRLQPGYHEELYGVAVDIGTTTIAAHLAELRSGRILATASRMNPQITYGEDLMSRVSYVMEQRDGLATLRGVVTDALNELVADATAEAEVTPGDVIEMVVVGNTIMHHVFLGIDPTALGGAPFATAIKDSLDVKARDLGLHIAPGANVYVPPVEAGYVGADNVAAIIAEEPHRRADVTLLIDVGTNGEIVLGNREQLLCASSPTGPAFEGAQVLHGMRAAPGAIERVRIDPATLEVRFKIIGREDWVTSVKETSERRADGPIAASRRPMADGGDSQLSVREARELRQRLRAEQQAELRAAGICGSGVIEAIAELFLAGVVDGSGRFVPVAPTERLQFEGAKGFFVLAWPHETSTGRAIVIHSDDIRAIQLAKAALYAGAKLLMRHYGLQHVDRIVLAGAFGSYIDPQHAMVLGLIPDCDLAQVKAVGNAAGDGALILLLNQEKRREADQIARAVQHVQTATDPHFESEFVAAIHIPHKRDPFPHLQPLLQAAAAQRIVLPPAENGSSSARSRAERRERRAAGRIR